MQFLTMISRSPTGLFIAQQDVELGGFFQFFDDILRSPERVVSNERTVIGKENVVASSISLLPSGMKDLDRDGDCVQCGVYAC
jgi:hypothetical protein